MSSTSPVSQQALLNRLCEKCRKEIGHPYTFHYGHRFSYSLSSTEARTHFQLKGTASVLIGDRCISRDRSRSLILRTALALGIVSALGIAFVASKAGLLAVPQAHSAALFCGWVLAGIIALASILAVVEDLLKSGEDRGEQIAISIRRESLERKGYDYFTTQHGWQSVKETERFQNR